MRFFAFLLPLLFVLCLPAPTFAQESTGTKEYVYLRDVSVPPYQTLREFFDMPNRPGRYEVTLLSEDIGPLTFRVIRVKGDHEATLGKKRSYRVGAHEFQQPFDNPQGMDDILVEIANSNPAARARVTVLVVELP